MPLDAARLDERIQAAGDLGFLLGPEARFPFLDEIAERLDPDIINPAPGPQWRIVPRLIYGEGRHSDITGKLSMLRSSLDR
jgi:hypothetical protein